MDDQWSDEFIGPVDLGNPTEFSIHELAQIIIELTGSKSRIVYQPLPEDDPQHRQHRAHLVQHEATNAHLNRTIKGPENHGPGNGLLAIGVASVSSPTGSIPALQHGR